ncbi:MAG: dihydroxyacetone kinase subunit L [Bacillota bacterium]|nr:dihydroxyacetone kinase subunit L [Bacillota bacterium]MDW7677167.1 dihydroxyacetone kinase subunit L [Bacillota bacterium]
MTSQNVVDMFEMITQEMVENKELLIRLDAQNGDGDLGLSMAGGFTKVSEGLMSTDEKDLGRLFLKISKTLNEAAPSTLGTLLSIVFMGMAKSLKGSESMDAGMFVGGLEAGVRSLMEKGGAKPGEKTIVDALYPAVDTMKAELQSTSSFSYVLEKGRAAAEEGMEKTKEMRSVHGRAAYYREKSIGIQDGGATVGMLLMKGCADYCRQAAKDS